MKRTITINLEEAIVYGEKCADTTAGLMAKCYESAANGAPNTLYE